ncbi:hypothetical protein XENTR_v10003975 [Xenopus tropicalis]|nr:hypothetical protein XENTR_v10003975 [Xenopus tropicalis]
MARNLRGTSSFKELKLLQIRSVRPTSVPRAVGMRSRGGLRREGQGMRDEKEMILLMKFGAGRGRGLEIPTNNLDPTSTPGGQQSYHRIPLSSREGMQIIKVPVQY